MSERERHFPSIIEENSADIERIINGQEINPSKEDLEWHRDNFEVSGKQVETIGVYHDPVALKEYGKELEDAIGRASVVILESAPTAAGLYSDKYLDYMSQEAKKRGIELNREEVKKKLKNRTGYFFFSVLEKVAARQGRKLGVVDPGSTHFQDQSDMESLKQVIGTDN